MRRAFLITVLAALSGSADAAVLRDTAGLVQVRAAGDVRWRPAGQEARSLSVGDAVRTGFDARAVVVLEAGEALVLSGNSHLLLVESSGVGSVVNLLFGSMRLSAQALKGRELVLRTPTATARARGETVSWTAAVSGGGNTALKVDKGLVGVEDERGRGMLLGEGQRLEADVAGLHEPAAAPTADQARRDEFAASMRRELALEFSRDEPQRLVAAETRRADHELGHVLTDADGRRVRAEEYLVRSSADSFSFVALNGRREGGLSWFTWTGVFDRALPRDLSDVFASLAGHADAPAAWTLVSYESVRGSLSDSLVMRGDGGHQVDLNSNADPTDDVSILFDPATDAYVSVAGRPVFRTIFDRSGLYADGALKRGWTGANLSAQADALPASLNDPITGAALAGPLSAFTANSTFPDGSSTRRLDLESYADGSELGLETRRAGDGFQQTQTATEFGGRSIQVLFSPRILAETGALP